jgi:hypothetical protein
MDKRGGGGPLVVGPFSLDKYYNLNLGICNGGIMSRYTFHEKKKFELVSAAEIYAFVF